MARMIWDEIQRIISLHYVLADFTVSVESHLQETSWRSGLWWTSGLFFCCKQEQGVMLSSGTEQTAQSVTYICREKQTCLLRVTCFKLRSWEMLIGGQINRFHRQVDRCLTKQTGPSGPQLGLQRWWTRTDRSGRRLVWWWVDQCTPIADQVIQTNQSELPPDSTWWWLPESVNKQRINRL